MKVSISYGPSHTSILLTTLIYWGFYLHFPLTILNSLRYIPAIILCMNSYYLNYILIGIFRENKNDQHSTATIDMQWDPVSDRCDIHTFSIPQVYVA